MAKIFSAQFVLTLALIAACGISLIITVHVSSRKSERMRVGVAAKRENSAGFPRGAGNSQCACPCPPTAPRQTQPMAALASGDRPSRMHAVNTEVPARFVVLVSIDGLRGDAVYPYTSMLRRIVLEGGNARDARTISESVTLPAHASMLSGVGVKKHGIGFDAFRLYWSRVSFPTIFTAAHAAGLSTAMFIGKRKLQLLDESASVDRIEFAASPCGQIARSAVPYLRSASSGLALVHFADLDSAGHRYGWMSEQYLRVTNRVDRCVAQLTDAIEQRDDFPRTLMLVTSDHGGHEKVHGTRRREDRFVPWIVWGGAAAASTQLQRPISITDTAATVLYALGLEPPSGIEGRPVLELLAPNGIKKEILSSPRKPTPQPLGGSHIKSAPVGAQTPPA